MRPVTWLLNLLQHYSLNGSDYIGHYRATKLQQEDNQWKSSGIVSDPVTLSEGQHTLSLIVITAEASGVDVDKVTCSQSGPCVDGLSVLAMTGVPSQQWLQWWWLMGGGGGSRSGWNSHWGD